MYFQHPLQHQTMPHQQQQRQSASVAEPVVVVPFNIPTKLNNTTASIPLLRPQAPSGPLPADYVPSNLDVCSGRGKRNWNHSGNVAFRDLIQHSTPAYMAAESKNEKTAIVCNIVEEMRSIGCKFLKEDSKTGRWYDIGDAQAREKVGHSLRDQVTAFNRSQGTTTAATEQEKPTHHRTLSDSGKEADSRRMSLDTTALFGQFARRPSWIAQCEKDAFLEAENATSLVQATASTSLPAEKATATIQTTDKTSVVSDDDQTNVGDNSNFDVSSQTPAATPIETSQSASTIPIPPVQPYEIRRYQYPIINENSELDPSKTTSTNHYEYGKEYEPSSRRSDPRQSLTITDIQSWDPNSTANTTPVNMESMMQESVQSWDPRLSSMSSMMSVVRRSHIVNMAGSTTLRRLTNNFRASEISMQSIQSFMDGMDFDDDDDDDYYRNEVFSGTENQSDKDTTTNTR